MTVREQLKLEIDNLDEHYLELLFDIVRQFPHTLNESNKNTQEIAKILQEIADTGGLGIADPVAWQRDIRQDRKLPFRT